MKNTILLILIAALVFPCWSQTTDENLTGEYINGVFYYKRLDYMRESYDRWQMIMKEHHPGEDVKKYNYGIFSAMNDFNFGKDVDTVSINPILIGYAFGTGTFGYYFLISTSDIRNAFKEETEESVGKFDAITMGTSFQTKWISGLVDATLASKTLNVYGKVFFPIIKSHFGIGTSRFDEVVDPVNQQTKITKSETLTPDQLSFSSSIIPYFNIGLRVLKYTKSRYMPNISFAAHQFKDPSEWDDMKWDSEFFFETRGEKIENIAEMKDFDARVTFYRLIGKPLVEEDGICLRWTLFGGLSYKSEIDYFTETLTESGKVYNGQSGVGGEVGAGLRVLGFKKYGFQEDTYVRFSYFYNYSNYFERYPGMQQGFKFKVVF